MNKLVEKKTERVSDTLCALLMTSLSAFCSQDKDISALGEVLLISHACVHSENGEKKEQLMLLFPGYLVMLSLSPRLSGYLYEVRETVVLFLLISGDFESRKSKAKLTNNSSAFQGKFPVSGMTVNPIEDDENDANAFEITGTGKRYCQHEIFVCHTTLVML